MEAQLWIEISVFLIALFAILGIWQRKIGRAERAKNIAEIRDAQERGTRKASSQYPHIEPLLCIGCGSCVAACPEEQVLGIVDGIAHVVHGSRCIGHGRCAEACPVGAITVGLGDVSDRPDIPILAGSLETTVPGIYIAGELGGIALIRHAVEQGSKAVEDIAKKLRQTRPAREAGVPDILIVGAGPAGLSASLRATELGISHVVIDQDDPGGTIRKYPRRKLVMLQPVDLPLHGRLKRAEYLKEELIGLWDGIIHKHGLEIRTPVRLLSIQRSGGGFIADTTGGPIESRFVILALGRRGTPRKLDVPGEESEKVLYQLIDAASYTDQRLLVVGGGDSAIEAAVALANQSGNTVTLSYRKPGFFRLKARNEARIGEYVQSGRIRTVLSSEVLSIGDDAVILAIREKESRAPAGKAVEVERQERVANDFVFVFAGGEPPFPLLKAMGIGFGGPRSAEVRREPAGEGSPHEATRRAAG